MTVDKYIDPSQLERALLNAFEFEPTGGQKRLFHAFSRFALSDKARCALLLRGYAGTGKTTCVSVLVNVIEQLGIRYVLLAPTGRAARVLANYSGRTAGTIHRHIYYSKQMRTGEGVFELKENGQVIQIIGADGQSSYSVSLVPVKRGPGRPRKYA